jgi:hypothetical protein
MSYRRSRFGMKNCLMNCCLSNRLSLMSWSPKVALPLSLCLSRPPIDSTLIPQGTPALLAGTEFRVLYRWNPDVAANVAAASTDGLPGHSLIIHSAHWT